MEMEFDLAGLDAIAQSLWQQYSHKSVWAFYAPMGSGKTTLIAALCRVIGCQDAVSSPTFSIINEYLLQNGSSLYHMDWYRLKGVEDAIEAGVQDLLERKNALVFIEWPELAEDLLNNEVLRIHLEWRGPETRYIKVS